MKLKLTSTYPLDINKIITDFCKDFELEDDSNQIGNLGWVEFGSLEQFERFIKDNQELCDYDEWVINLKTNELEFYNGYRE